MRLRFSIRRLLLLTTCVAAACWWLDQPRQRMDRFMAAVEAGDYEQARSMIDADHAALIHLPSAFAAESPNHKWGMWRHDASWRDWLQGRRCISINGVRRAGWVFERADRYRIRDSRALGDSLAVI